MRAIVERLCALADMKAPPVGVERDRAPLVWTVAAPGRRPRVYATTGLLDALPSDELAAVLAHEVAHVAHRDAALMTVLSAPGVLVVRGLFATARDSHPDDRLNALLVAPVTIVFAVPFALLGGLARLVSRHREYAADRAAAELTGSPAALASALQRLAGRLDELPQEDLRVVAARDPLNILPARRATGIRRLWATHPPLADRLAQLERLERDMHVPVMPAPP